MGKLIKTIALVAIAVAVVVFAAPIAAGIGVALGSVGISLSLAAVSAIASSLVAIGLSVGLSAISSLFRKAPASISASMTDRLNTSVNPTAPRKIVFGVTAGGNDIRFFETYGSDKSSYVQVIALASHQLTEITNFYVESDVTWTKASGVVKNANGFNSIRAVELGTSSNGFALGSKAYWTSTATMTGCAYLAIDWKLDSKIWTSGIPSKITTLVKGCPLYDPRLDSTNGGSGPHRTNDQSTWAFTANGVDIGRNPANALLTYLIGWRVSGKLMWGMGVPISSINFDNFRTYANVCEEQVLCANGTYVQRYTCDGMYSTADSHETVISGITAAMGSCKFTDVSGQYQLVGGFDDTMGPIQNFTVSDLMSAPNSPQPYVWTPTSPAADIHNSVSGRFADPTAQYALNTWGVVEIDTLADGVPRPLTLDLQMVSRPETCQRIGKQFLLREALTPGSFSATFGPRAFAVQVGSLCTLTIAAEGWNAKLFRVIEQKEIHDMLYQMTLKEESSAVYAWDREEKALPANIRPPGYDASLAFQVSGMGVTSVSYQSVA